MHIKKINSKSVNREIFQRVAGSVARSAASQEGYTVDEAVESEDKELSRRIRAIVKAGAFISKGVSFSAFSRGDKVEAVTVGSASEWSVTYAPTEETCQCRAFENGFTCWHRQLVNILKHYVKVEFYEEKLREAYSRIGIRTVVHETGGDSAGIEEIIFPAAPAQRERFERFLQDFRQEFVVSQTIAGIAP